jgi:hypothetical protein
MHRCVRLLTSSASARAALEVIAARAVPVGRCGPRDAFVRGDERRLCLRFEIRPFLVIGRDALPDGLQQFFIVERLRQEVHCAGLDGAYCHGDVAVACEEYDRDLNIRFRQLLLHVESADTGQVHVQHQATRRAGRATVRSSSPDAKVSAISPAERIRLATPSRAQASSSTT